MSHPRLWTKALCSSLAATLASGTLMVGACQASPVEPQQGGDRGTQELKQLLARTAGKPSANDLAAFEVQRPNTRAGALARFLRGYQAYERGDWTSTLAAMDGDEIGKVTALGDYAYLYRGRAEAKLNRLDDAEKTLAKVGDRFADSIVARDATLEAARAAWADNDGTDAERRLASLVAAGDGEAAVLAAQIRTAAGDTPGAIRLYRVAYFNDPASASAGAALTQLRALGADPETSPANEQELRNRAERLYAAEAWVPAKDAYTRLVTTFGSGGDRDKLNLRRGTAAANARDAATATAALLAVSNADRELHAQALYQLARAYLRTNRLPEFESTGERLRSTYPSSDWTGEYLGDLASSLESRKRMGELVAVQRALIQNFPRSAAAAEASYDAAWLAYRTNDFARAAQLFQEHLTTFRTPTTKWIGESAYWGGRAYEATGNKPRALLFYSLAQERYPYGYHGHIAGNRAKNLVRANPGLAAEKPAPSSPLDRARSNALAVAPIVETADGRAEPRVARALDLQAIELWDVAQRELVDAQKTFPDSPLVNLRLAQVYRARGDNYQATLVLRKGYPDVYSYRDDQMPREAWEVMFPLTNWDLIQREAKAQNIDPFVIAGLIRQESVYNPRALSRSNARGLMQLLPSTAKLVSRAAGRGDVSAADLFSPSINVPLGTDYFAQQLRKFGRVEHAAAAYNAGPGRVVQWKAARPNDPIEEWVENIPFSETRGYVMGVMRYSFNYRRFYGRGAEREAND